MKKILITVLGVAIAAAAFAQEERPTRQGFAFGGYLGAGAIYFSSGNAGNDTQGHVTLLNFQAGHLFNDRFGIFLKTAGNSYEVEGRDRSLDGYIVSAQYWTSDKFWISGGYGPAMDIRAFWESKSESEGVNWGHGVLLAGGYEVMQRKKWALDLQTRLYMASVKLDDGARREATTVSLGVGITFF
ncbi:MAG: hypothetical protein AAGA85_04930 [Bacteroidota bacterium]